MQKKNLFYDYPRLVKESGFSFQFRSRSLEWAEIGKIDVDDIANNRRFEQLEKSLDMVLHCDLDAHFTKVLDQNFIKLFRLAQLGISYLTYCQSYLDNCVIFLQEQLSAALENNKSTTNNRTESGEGSFKCDVCEKTFLSAAYLNSHHRRRHTDPQRTTSTGTQTELPQDSEKKFVSAAQQTDITRTISLETQTSVRCHSIGVNTTYTEKETEQDNEFSEQIRELQDRMKKMETRGSLSPSMESLLKERLDKRDEGCVALPSAPPYFLPPLVHYIPSYVQQPPLQSEINFPIGPGDPAMSYMPRQHISKDTPLPVNKQLPIERSLASDTEISAEEKIPVVKSLTNRQIDQENMNVQSAQPYYQPSPKQRRLAVSWPKTSQINEEAKPVPKPRITNIMTTPRQNFIMDSEQPHPSIQPSELEKEIELLANSDAALINLFEVEDKPFLDECRVSEATSSVGRVEDLMDFHTSESSEEQQQSIGNIEDLTPKKETVSKPKKGLFKKIVRGSSPKLKNLGESLRRSWSNLYESITPISKSQSTTRLKEQKPREIGEQTLECRLDEMGIDRSQSGISDEMFQKSTASLDQQRTLLAKKYPSYLNVRKLAEESVNQRLLKAASVTSLNIDETEKDGRHQKQSKAVIENANSSTVESILNLQDIETLPEELDTEIGKELQAGTREVTGTKNSESVITEKKSHTVMYDLDSDSDFEPDLKLTQKPKLPDRISPLISQGETIKPDPFSNTQTVSMASKPRETDLSIFEISRKKSDKIEIATTRSSDSSDESIKLSRSKTAKPTTKPLKSSLLNKDREEVKKKVVFADKFEMEVAPSLLDVGPDSPHSSDSSDWDIPIP